MMKYIFGVVAAVFLGFVGTAGCQDPVKIISEFDGAVYCLSEGTQEDIPRAQEYYTAFHLKWHEGIYSDIPVEMREFPNPKEDIAARFSRNTPLILEGALKFFVLKKEDGTFSGYSLVDVTYECVDGEWIKTIYSIDTALYVRGINDQFHAFLQQATRDVTQPATGARCYKMALWKPMLHKWPNYEKNFGGKHCNDIHSSITNPAGYYQDATLQSKSEHYQGLERMYEYDKV